MDHGSLETSSARIYWESHGDGPAVVLAHGIGGNHAIWFRQIAALSQTHRVIVFDHRGFGLSQDIDGAGRDGFVDDLAALLDHLNVEKAALVGQSMGAGTCVGFACKYPERVAALAIVDSLHGIEESGEVATIMNAARSETEDLSQIERVLGPGAEQEIAVLYSAISSFNKVDRHSLTGQFATVSPEAIGELGCPVLFLVGEHDKLFPPKAVELVQEKVPGSFLVEVSGAGHSAFLERPVEFNDTVLSLLQMAGHVGASGVKHSNTQGYEAQPTG
jgi:pimeloyl-ACP methyl ester carboxylesterase